MVAVKNKHSPKIVEIPSIRDPIQPSPGFAKKQLSQFKLDVMGLCQYGCRYCSSNAGNYLRINQESFADQTEEQLGERLYPAAEPSLTFQWPDVVERLEKQLARKPKSWGAGQTLVYSMQTDGFSPMAVQSGLTEKALRMVLEATSFRIRVLTKNAVVGQEHWIRLFQEYPNRFVVGLSIGTLDDNWAREVEISTSTPTSRLAAQRKLQEAGVATYGMLCPVFPDVLDGQGLEELIDQIQPHLCEHVWAEPFNDRQNWRAVQAGYAADSTGWKWFTEVFESHCSDRWSAYATELYVRLRDKALSEGWLGKLRYLLYEQKITANDAKHFRDLRGVLLQAKPRPDGKSTNRFLAPFQARVGNPR